MPNSTPARALLDALRRTGAGAAPAGPGPPPPAPPPGQPAAAPAQAAPSTLSASVSGYLDASLILLRFMADTVRGGQPTPPSGLERVIWRASIAVALPKMPRELRRWFANAPRHLDEYRAAYAQMAGEQRAALSAHWAQDLQRFAASYPRLAQLAFGTPPAQTTLPAQVTPPPQTQNTPGVAGMIADLTDHDTREVQKAAEINPQLGAEMRARLDQQNYTWMMDLAKIMHDTNMKIGDFHY
jgi:hypothetical protein